MKRLVYRPLRPLRFYLGIFLMVTAVSLLLFIYLPVLMVYYQPSLKIKAYTDNDFHIIIPKINAESTINLEVDPWNQASYLPQLQKGVVHAKGTPIPGENGTSYLFAHSSDLPWRMTRYNTPFLRLGELKTGDLVMISQNNQTIEYRVTDIKEVAPWDVKYLKEAENSSVEDSQKKLILQTCSPPGTSLRRLLVFAQNDQ